MKPIAGLARQTRNWWLCGKGASDGAFVDAWNLELLGYIHLVKAVISDQIRRRDASITEAEILVDGGQTPSI